MNIEHNVSQLDVSQEAGQNGSYAKDFAHGTWGPPRTAERYSPAINGLASTINRQPLPYGKNSMKLKASLLFHCAVDKKESIALLLLRLVAGTAFIFHGLHKISEPFTWLGAESHIPGFFQALAAISEFGGGIAWIIGLLTPLASLGMISTMTVAVWSHVSKGQPFVGPGSYEAALGYLAVSVVLLLIGPGWYSIDALLFGRKGNANSQAPNG